MKKGYLLESKDIAAIEQHYKKYFTKAGAEDTGLILHEMVSDDMHIDLVHYKPTSNFDYHIFATIGMSGYTMSNAPWKNTELIMFLPSDWKVTKQDFEDEKWYWPLRMLKSAARLPYTCNSFLTVGHTFSSDEQNTPLDSSTKMCSGFVTFPTWLDQKVFTLKYGGLFNKKQINFLCLTAVDVKELNLIRAQGPQKFCEEVLVLPSGQDDLAVRSER